MCGDQLAELLNFQGFGAAGLQGFRVSRFPVLDLGYTRGSFFIYTRSDSAHFPFMERRASG